MSIKKKLERDYVSLCTQSIDEGTDKYSKKIEELQYEVSALDAAIGSLINEQSGYYNPKWERIFRAGAEESFFAHQVDRFACIYMEQLSDFLGYAPITYFRANRRLLAHDFEFY